MDIGSERQLRAVVIYELFSCHSPGFYETSTDEAGDCGVALLRHSPQVIEFRGSEPDSD
jgi:hypothetical protein